LNREDAEKALGIIRHVIQNSREDLVAHNWGVIWMIHAFANGAACLAGWYVEINRMSIIVYMVPLAVAGLINLIVVMLLATRDQGVRSSVMWYMHGIWVTFIVFTAAFALVMYLSDTDPKLFGSVFCMTSGIGFAMMGVVFSRQIPFAVLFLAVMVAGPFLPGVQWGLIGLLWWAAQFLPGLSMYREKRRRALDATQTRIV
jgi:hypothetical protein